MMAPTTTLSVRCPLCGDWLTAISEHPAAGDGDLDVVLDELGRELKEKRARHLAAPPWRTRAERAGYSLWNGDVPYCEGSEVQF